jgi:hypothetical protein
MLSHNALHILVYLFAFKKKSKGLVDFTGVIM